MARKTKVMSFSLTPQTAGKIDELAKRQARSRSELIGEMVAVYEERQAEREWEDLFVFGAKTARRFSIKSEEELFKLLNKD